MSDDSITAAAWFGILSRVYDELVVSEGWPAAALARMTLHAYRIEIVYRVTEKQVAQFVAYHNEQLN